MGLRFEPGSRAALAGIPPPAKRRLKAALRIIEADPGDAHLDLRLLDHEGPYRTYRCRVQAYRIVYEVRSDATYVKRIFHRRDGYGWLERMG